MSITVGNWSYYVTIPESYAPASSITGYVGLITEDVIAKLSSGDQTTFWSNVKNGGGDVRICTNSDGTGQLPVEIVSLDNVGQTCQIWYRLGTYTGTGDLYLFIGNASATQPVASATYGRNAVWVDYEASYNLSESVNNTSGGYVDSTGNGLDATGSSMALPTVAANFGEAQDFDGTSDHIRIPTAAITPSQTNNSFVLSSWVNMDSLAGDGTLLGRFTNTADFQFLLYMDAGGTPNYRLLVSGNGGLTATSTGSGGALLNGWQLVHATWDGTTASVFVDGALNDSAVGARTLSSQAGDASIGTNDGGSTSRAIDGKIHSVRISSSINANLTGYIATEYANQSNPATFYGTPTIAATGGGGGLTISPTGIASGESVGSPSVAVGTITLGVSAIPSEESFGTPTLTSGASLVQPSSIGTEEAFGTPSIDVGSVLIEPISIVSEESFGIPEVVSGLTAITPVGIISAEAFGTCLVENLLAVIEPSGIPTDELFGNPVILGGDRIVIPISSRVTWNKVAAYLRGLTFVGSDNDVIIKWLRSEGYEGQYNDSFNSYLEITECYKGTLTDKYAQWRRGDTPTGCWLLEGGIWNDNGSWIDTEFWED